MLGPFCGSIVGVTGNILYGFSHPVRQCPCGFCFDGRIRCTEYFPL
jgi:hypothetical protein